MAFDEELRAETNVKIRPVLELIKHVCEQLPNNVERRAFLKQVKHQAYRLLQPRITDEEAARRLAQSAQDAGSDVLKSLASLLVEHKLRAGKPHDIIRDRLDPLIKSASAVAGDLVTLTNEKNRLWHQIKYAVIEIANSCTSHDEAQELCQLIWRNSSACRGAIASGFIRATGKQLKTGKMDRNSDKSK